MIDADLSVIYRVHNSAIEVRVMTDSSPLLLIARV